MHSAEYLLRQVYEGTANRTLLTHKPKRVMIMRAACVRSLERRTERAPNVAATALVERLWNITRSMHLARAARSQHAIAARHRSSPLQLPIAQCPPCDIFDLHLVGGISQNLHTPPKHGILFHCPIAMACVIYDSPAQS